jgi:glycosyltransferase involved in cell wall biosynthesis
VESGNYSVAIVSAFAKEGEPAYRLDPRIKNYFMDFQIPESRVKRIFTYINFLKRLEKIESELKIDFVIGTNSFLNMLIIFLKTKSKKIGCEHFGWFAYGRREKLKKWIFYKKLDAVVLLTKKDMKNYSFLKNSYEIPNSLSFATEKKSCIENKILLAVGRLENQKGFDFLIDAATELKKRLPGWKIKIYGKGSLEKDLRAQIKFNGLEDFVFILPPEKNIEKIYAESSIYVMTSRHEGLPMVLIESQACGLPAVSFDCPNGPDEIIENGKNGFLVEFQDNADLIDKIEKIATNEKLYLEMQNESVKLSKRFSTESIFLLWDDLFKKLQSV